MVRFLMLLFRGSVFWWCVFRCCNLEGAFFDVAI
jgi:hypothetical protein